MAFPYFASALPGGTYGLRVIEDPDGTPTTLDITVTLPEPGVTSGAYWFPNALALVHVSVWHLLCTALTAASAGTYSTTGDVANDARGVGLALTNTLGTGIKIDHGNSIAGADGVLPLEWLGWDSQTDPSSGGLPSLPTVIQPQYTWCPRNRWNPVDDAPDEAAMGQSAATGDGSFHAVDMTDGTVRRWSTFETIDLGFVRGRASQSALIPPLGSSYVDWAAVVGAANTDDGTPPTWVALDGEGGWWQRTRSGRVPWLYFEDSANILTSIAGVYQINTTGGPVSMDGWSGLRMVERGSSLQGRKRLRFCARRLL